MSADVGAVVLAAGLGTRMKSARPKLMHELGGRPMLMWAVESVRQAIQGGNPVVVVGPEARTAAQNLLGAQTTLALQVERLGTGHAALQAADALSGVNLILVTSADMPLLRAETLRKLVETQRRNHGPLTLLAAQTDSPRGFGRVVRDGAGHVMAVVEEAGATPEQLRLREVNAGAYCFRGDWLWGALRRLPLSPKGEHYLTDLVATAVAEAGAVGVAGPPRSQPGRRTAIASPAAVRKNSRRLQPREPSGLFRSSIMVFPSSRPVLYPATGPAGSRPIIARKAAGVNVLCAGCGHPIAAGLSRFVVSTAQGRRRRYVA